MEDVEPYVSPEEEEGFVEGDATAVITNRYERNRRARQACIDHYGTACTVCGIDFEKCYGIIGKGFIHVHHLVDLATIGESYQVDPIKDLRPVCPNCHAMLHTSRPALSIAELRTHLRWASGPSGGPHLPDPGGEGIDPEQEGEP